MNVKRIVSRVFNFISSDRLFALILVANEKFSRYFVYGNRALRCVVILSRYIKQHDFFLKKETELDTFCISHFDVNISKDNVSFRQNPLYIGVCMGRPLKILESNNDVFTVSV